LIERAGPGATKRFSEVVGIAALLETAGEGLTAGKCCAWQESVQKMKKQQRADPRILLITPLKPQLVLASTSAFLDKP
jgi:hypothetical protein